MRHTALALILTVICGAPGAAQEKDGKLVPSITVVGTGKVNATPDISIVQVGVTSEAKEAAEALAKNNKDMQALLELLRGKGIENKDVQTSQFSIGPKYDYGQQQMIQQAPFEQEQGNQGPRRPKRLGYAVTNMVQVKVRKLNELGGLLDALVRAGANNVQGISFTIDEPEALMAKARIDAMQQAKKRAEELAAAGGVKVGQPLLIQEQSLGMPWPVAAPMAMAGPAGGEVPLAAGEQTLTTQVTVTYALHY